MTAPIGALLIDLDDTLFPESALNDSGLRAAALALASRTGLHTEEALGRLRYEQQSEGRAGAFARTCDWFGADPGDAAAMRRAYDDHAPALRLYPGAAEALLALRARFRVAIVAPGPMGRTLAMALKLEALADTVVLCAQDDAPPPPAPDALILAAARLGVAPAHCLVVGDDPYRDALAAGAFGARFCRVLTGRFRQVEAGPAPFLRIPDIMGLPAAPGLAG